MGIYVACPSCTNVMRGTKIYRCKNGGCAEIYCGACSARNGGCPQCGHTFWFPNECGQVVGGDVAAVAHVRRVIRVR